MKEPYLEPAVDVYSLLTSGSILTASNEGYDINPFDPGFSSSSFDGIPGFPGF